MTQTLLGAKPTFYQIPIFFYGKTAILEHCLLEHIGHVRPNRPLLLCFIFSEDRRCGALCIQDKLCVCVRLKLVIVNILYLSLCYLTGRGR